MKDNSKPVDNKSKTKLGGRASDKVREAKIDFMIP